MPHGQDLLGMFQPIHSQLVILTPRLKNLAALLGIVHRMEIESKSEASAWYIQVIAMDGQPIIITFLSSLVKWIHLAHVTSHDNTYKRIIGDWKEWEIVAWIETLNMHMFMSAYYLVSLKY